MGKRVVVSIVAIVRLSKLLESFLCGVICSGEGCVGG